MFHDRYGKINEVISKNIIKANKRSDWLTPVILATQETEIGKIVVSGQHRQVS
jgi:hypothetical protein